MMPGLLGPPVVTLPLVMLTPGPTPIAPAGPGGARDGGGGGALSWTATMPRDWSPRW